MIHAAPRGSEGVVVIFLIVVAAAAGCRKVTSQDERRATDEPPSGASEQVSVAPTAPPVLPARCPKSGRTIALGDAGVQDDLEIGDVVAYRDGYAVSFARNRGATRNAAVALLGPDPAEAPRVVELGAVLSDAPPPLLARRSGDLLAAAFPVLSGYPHADRRRALLVYALSADGPPLTPLPGPGLWFGLEQPDDSTVTDMASDGRKALVVWDETSSSGRGVIRIGPLADAQRSTASVSPIETDAEVPRIVAQADGYSVLWIARSPELAAAGDASEVTGAAREFGWLQRVTLDALGVARGRVRDLTPRNGHVSAYDARVFGPQSVLVVVARDDGEAIDGSGGALLRIRAPGDAIEPPERLAVDGVGRGAPAFVEGKPPWLAWTGSDEVVRLLPLDEAGLPSGPASAEDFMSDARPLAWRLTAAGAAQWLIATPTAPAGPLRVVECAAVKRL